MDARASRDTQNHTSLAQHGPNCTLHVLTCGVVLALLVEIAAAQQASVVDHYLNPLDVSVADPQILKDADTYYLYGTSVAHLGFEVFSSKDLVHWRGHGLCFRRSPGTWGKDNFWAPEVIRKDDKYYLFFTCFSPKAGVRNICVAVSDSPLGPFREAVAPILPADRGFIDGHPFRDPDTGKYYLYALEENLRPPVIQVAPLADDLLSITTGTVACLTATQPWESNWAEAPFVVKHGKFYYMVYSGEGYASINYAIGYATAEHPLGPWTKYRHNPILRRNAAVSGTGHNSLVVSPDGSEWFTAYHRHLSFAGGGQRELAIDRIQFLDNGDQPPILAVDGPTHVPRPRPSGAPTRNFGKSDEFEASSLDWTRWMTVGEDPSAWKLERGHLRIDTQDGDMWTDRPDAHNLFLQYAPEGDFILETRVQFEPTANFEQAFLLVWQDQGNYIKLATLFADGPYFETARELQGQYEGVKTANTFGSSLDLRIEKSGTTYDFRARPSSGGEWAVIGVPVRADLPQIQVGIGAGAPASKASRPARFDFLHISPRNPAQSR